MVWQVLNVIGTIAFAVSGSIVAMEEGFDLLGLFVLGFVTAFGGGMVRNLVLGLPVTNIWHQPGLFLTATFTIFLVFVMPSSWLRHWHRMGSFFDALGLASFAIEGATYAHAAHSTLTTTIIAALMTGIGGGIIRDILAGRKPLVFRTEIYALWCILAGLVIGLNLAREVWMQYALFAVVAAMRMISLRYGWELPRKSLTETERTWTQ
ncbi:trimeric intracellular cation channel family protein [Alicyclobacillus fastidiosus]|uniref:Trimeric intracellular cation channel family protein n=1 Tax=Alicyclobacillus fastidiosus TaxID=392011 RepID=A0ABV5AJX1_9BACL|nr:trimeric intracellular cation channel family protein [Alicyclobacillus fastidiosus]WEH12081.1 trimeric intracellular cation channel family protein [Alicyclobacillus fastidiosus]